MAQRIANSLNLFREGPLGSCLHSEDQDNIVEILDYFYDTCDEIEDDNSSDEDFSDRKGTKIRNIKNYILTPIIYDTKNE